MVAVSIIIPVYNAVDCLERCVNSILSQSFEAMEIILVDDGSADQSWQVCQRLAKQSERIRIYHQENAGEGSARNFGVSVARGKYIMFADNDDYLPPGAVESMVAAMEESGADLAIGDYIRAHGEALIQKRFLKGTDILSVPDYCIAQANCPRLMDYYFIVLWNKIFRRDIILENGIAMQAHVKLNDYGYVLDYLKYTRSIKIVHEPVYVYEYRATSDLQQFKHTNPSNQWISLTRLYQLYIPFAESILSSEVRAVCEDALKNMVNGTRRRGISVIVPICSGEINLSAFDAFPSDVMEIILAVGEDEAEATKRMGGIMARDGRVRLLSLPGEDTAAIKNAALEEAVGKYVLFIRPDQVLDANRLETAARALDNSKAQLAIWDDQRNPNPQEVPTALFLKYLKSRAEHGAFSLKNILFKWEIIEREEPCFNPARTREDISFFTDFLNASEKILIL